MNVEFSEIQKQMQSMARDFLKNECKLADVRKIIESSAGYSRDLWQTMGELGWLNMIFPEKYGGMGCNLLDLAVIYEEMGRVLLPSPHLTSVVLSGLTILDGGTEEQKSFFLPKIGSGEIVVALALDEPEYAWGTGKFATAAVRDGDGFVINGTKLFIPYAHNADQILCVARTADNPEPMAANTVFLIEKDEVSGITCERLHGLLGEALCEVTFDNTHVPANAVLGEVNNGWTYLNRALQTGIILQCCAMVGGAEYVYQLTMDYSKMRKQFGVFIGSFQRIQDRIINMLNELDKSRLMTYEAAWRLSENIPADLEVSIAKAVTGSAYKKICDESHYVHAGIGFMSDYDLDMYTKHSRTTASLLGSPSTHRTIATDLLLKKEVSSLFEC